MLLIDKIETELIKILEGKNKEVVLHVHTFIASHLTKGLNSIQMQWILKYKKWIKIMPRDAFPYLKYQFYNENDKKWIFGFEVNKENGIDLTVTYNSYMEELKKIK